MKLYTVFQIESGWMGIAGSSQGICRTTFPEDSHEEALLSLDLADKFQESPTDYFADLVQSFKNYYRGLPVEFKVRLDFSGLTDFQKSVYKAAMSIPFGETRSYGWLAKQIDKPLASRAVGQALGRNPFPILVPCHRVLAAGDKLGGFSAGLPLKQYLLNLENIKIP
jgi:methylated-DNA-[protein]-cysteine S-methyltransferase